MAGRIPFQLSIPGGARPIGATRGGRKDLPEFPHGEKAGPEPRREEPDSAEVRKLARKLASEFGREYLLASSRVRPAGSDSIADVVAVQSIHGITGVEGRGPRLLEAVETAPNRISRLGISRSSGKPRGAILNFLA